MPAAEQRSRRATRKAKPAEGVPASLGNRLRRTALGVLAVLLLATAAVLYAIDPANLNSIWLTSSLRCGMVLAALWLAFPQLDRLPSVLLTVVIVAALGVAVLAKTKLMLPILLGMLLMLLVLRALKPRSRRQ